MTTLPRILAVVPVAKLIVVGTPRVVPLSCIVIAPAVDVDTAYPFEYIALAYTLPATPTPPNTCRAPDVLEVAELELVIVMIFGPNPVAVTAMATNVAVLNDRAKLAVLEYVDVVALIDVLTNVDVLNVNVTTPVEVLIEPVTAVPVKLPTATAPPTTSEPEVETPTPVPPI